MTSTSNLVTLSKNKQLKNDDFYETYLKSFGIATPFRIAISWKVEAPWYTPSRLSWWHSDFPLRWRTNEAYNCNEIRCKWWNRCWSSTLNHVIQAVSGDGSREISQIGSDEDKQETNRTCGLGFVFMVFCQEGGQFVHQTKKKKDDSVRMSHQNMGQHLQYMVSGPKKKTHHASWAWS